MKSETQHTQRIQLEERELWLLADRGVYWPMQDTLFVADLHLGKEASFRRGGIPLPVGGTDETLARITKMLAATGAGHLVVLGDLFHTKTSLSNEVCNSVEQFFQQHKGLLTTLVPGNHDAHVGSLPTDWPIEKTRPGLVVEGVMLSHEPHQPPKDVSLVMCGHVHPTITWHSKTDRLRKLPCFHLDSGCFVLPAIGKLTSGQTIRRSKNDRVWLIADGQIIAVGRSGSDQGSPE